MEESEKCFCLFSALSKVSHWCSINFILLEMISTYCNYNPVNFEHSSSIRLSRYVSRNFALLHIAL